MPARLVDLISLVILVRAAGRVLDINEAALVKRDAIRPTPQNCFACGRAGDPPCLGPFISSFMS